MSKQSSIEWLIDQLEEKGDAWENASIRRVNISIDVSEYMELKTKSKAMHKEEVRDSFYIGRYEYNNFDSNSIEYYNETFGGNNEQTNKKTTALNDHIKWLKKELQTVIDNGESIKWIYAYQLAIKNAEKLLKKERRQIILAITATLPIEDSVATAIDKAQQYYNETFGE